MPRQLYLHIHGTTDVPFLEGSAAVAKPVSKLMAWDLYTFSTETKMMPLKDGPSGVENFKPLYEDIDERNRFFCQWSGNLGEKYWKEEAEKFYQQIKKMNEEEDIDEITIVAHSHGGQIARYLAQKLPNIKFHVVTIATPMITKPSPVLMPKNVETWQHFYHSWDPQQYAGSWLAQGNSGPVKRRIEDVLDLHPMGRYRDRELPKWKSHEITFNYNVTKADLHHAQMRPPATDQICKIVKPLLPKRKIQERKFKEPDVQTEVQEPEAKEREVKRRKKPGKTGAT